MFEILRKPKGIAVIALFAALHAVLSSLPYTITIGIGGGSITLGIISAPLIGILLGPISGGIAVTIGSIIGMFINPSGAIFGILSFLPPSLGAFSAGFSFKKLGYISAAMILGSILLFYSNPNGIEATLYPFMHIIALILGLAFSTRLAIWSVEDTKIEKLGIGIPIAAFIGTLTDHIFGSSLAIWILDVPAPVWNTIIFVYPIERIVAVIIITVIAIPLFYSLKRSGMLNIIKS
ncbi:hypothetical protein KJN74_00010 [Candidatus Bathyarchaeota archaeon]|nr:hypothetical protein [Candidatus Bathyarchaeota archaeon]